jgi:hypothetical protein
MPVSPPEDSEDAKSGIGYPLPRLPATPRLPSLLRFDTGCVSSINCCSPGSQMQFSVPHAQLRAVDVCPAYATRFPPG